MITTSPSTPEPSITSTSTSSDAATPGATTASPRPASADTTTAAAAPVSPAEPEDADTQGPDGERLLARLRDEALAWVREEPLKAVALAAAAGALLALCLPARSSARDDPP